MDVTSNSLIVDEIAGVADLRLVQIRLRELLVCEVVVGLEVEVELVPGWAVGREIADLHIGERLERVRVAIGDQLSDAGVVAQCSEPELGNRGRLALDRYALVVILLLLGLLDARGDLLSRRLRITRDDCTTAFEQWLLELEILRHAKSNRLLISTPIHKEGAEKSAKKRRAFFSSSRHSSLYFVW